MTSAANPIATIINGDPYSVVGTGTDDNTGHTLLFSSPVSVADGGWGTAVSIDTGGEDRRQLIHTMLAAILAALLWR